MIRQLPFLLLAPAAFAGIWPDAIDGWQRKTAIPAAISDKGVWQEYGLEASERADFVKNGITAHGTAWRMKDPTSALAVYQWQHPKGKPSELAKLAVETPDGGVFLAYGNYVLSLEGFRPGTDTFNQILIALPRLDLSALPALPGFLPKDGLVAGSERYLLGPVALEKFEPRIPIGLAAFSLSAEAQTAKFKAPDGEQQLTIFSYPTQQIAKERLEEFRKVPGIMGTRSGPLVALIPAPTSLDSAERLLALVNHRVTLTFNSKQLAKDENMGAILTNIFILTGILLGFCIFAGVAFGGLRVLAQHFFGLAKPGESMITLHLEEK
jgi:hypothetical protein